MAYKKDVNDLRESASLKIFKKIDKIKNVNLKFYDTYIKSIRINKKIIKSIKMDYKN